MSKEIKSGWERVKRIHFDNIVEKYDLNRLQYPKELFGYIFEYNQLNGKNALKIGSGTGIATTKVLE